MITSAIDINDRLVNGLVGRVTQFKYSNNVVSVGYVNFNDGNAGLETMRSDVTARQYHWVPINNHATCNNHLSKGHKKSKNPRRFLFSHIS